MLTLEDCQRHREAFEKNVRAFLYQPEASGSPEASGGPDASGGQTLSGVAVALKDNLCVQGWPATAGSRMLQTFVPPYEATVVRRLKEAGATLVGKTNLDEFAMGSSTENSAYQVTANPWDLERVPGGSSGGSAAAVAAEMCHMALGSDTGGSIRQPAAFCGITGLKPTYGRVSRFGLIAYGSSLDQIGPMAYTASDCARLLQVIAGPDELDSTCYQQPAPDFSANLGDSLKGLRLGWDESLLNGLGEGVRGNFLEALERYRSLGCELVSVQLPTLEHALPAYYLIATAEASSNLARYDGVRYGLRVAEGKDVAEMMSLSRAQGFGAEVKRRIMLGTYALSAGYYDAFYHKAQKVRTLLRQDFSRVFEEVQALALPTTPTPAFRIGEKASDPLEMYLSDVYTVSANLTGLPALSHPCGFLQGLPLGLQLTAPAWQEALLLRLAHQFQQASDYHLQRPALIRKAEV